MPFDRRDIPEPGFEHADRLGRFEGPSAPGPELVQRPSRPFFSWALFAASVVLFLPQLAQPGVELPWSLHGPSVAAGEWWRILTAQVEHHGLLHILANGFSILGFGPFVERRVGTVRLAVVSLVAGLFSAAFALHFSWDGYTAGASGIIIGWLGLGLPIVEPRWRRVLLQWAVFNALLSLGPSISWSGHLGGFVGGILCGAVMRVGSPAVPPTTFRLFDRVAVILVAAAALAAWAAVALHSATAVGPVSL